MRSDAIVEYGFGYSSSASIQPVESMVPARTIFQKLNTFGPVLKGATVVLSVIGGSIGVKEYYDANPSIDVSGQWLATNRIDQTTTNLSKV
ncbi:MAG: hypothetical protein IPG10_14940 [Flavobacteriales bacterium]|nr:hypothetical protein [Flavobacteriales bacterium]